MTPAPVACTLTPEHLRCDAAVLLPGLLTLSSRAAWLTNGMQLTFDATTENLSAIVRTVERERQCCAFLTFELSVPAESQPIVLTLHGPEGTREFLTQLGLTASSS
jgi:hypothetical protein